MQRGRPKGSKNRPRKEKAHPQRVVFSQPPDCSLELFVDTVSDYGGPAMVAKDLRISRELLGRYLAGEVPVPYATWCALWWQSWRGFNQAFSETHYTHTHNFYMRRRAEAQRLILYKTIERARELLPVDHPVGALLIAGLVRCDDPPSIETLNAHFFDASLAAQVRLPFISAELLAQLEARLAEYRLLPATPG